MQMIEDEDERDEDPQTTLSAGVFEREAADWDAFRDAINPPDQGLRSMIHEAAEYANAMQASGRLFPTDSFLISILLIQHRTIKRLEGELADLERSLLATRYP